MPIGSCSEGETVRQAAYASRAITAPKRRPGRDMSTARRLDGPLRTAVVTPLSHSRDSGLYIAASRIMGDIRIFVPRRPVGDWPTGVSVTAVPCTGSRLTSQWMHGLSGQLRQFRADVIHVHNEPWSLMAQQMIRLRTAVVIHGGENLYRDAPLSLRVRRAGTRRVLAGAAGYLNWGQTGLRAASDAGLPTRTPRGVIPGSPPDPGTFTHTPMPPYNGELRLAFVGRLVAEKGLDTLISAMATEPLRGRTRLTVVADRSGIAGSGETSADSGRERAIRGRVGCARPA